MLSEIKIFAVIAALVASFFGGMHYSELEWEAKMAKADKAAHTQYVAHVEQIGSLQTALEKANEDAKLKDDQLRAALRAGTQRLYVPIVTATTSATSEPTEERGQLDPTVADALVTITQDGDTAIRELNMCIDAYNTLRTK